MKLLLPPAPSFATGKSFLATHPLTGRKGIYYPGWHTIAAIIEDMGISGQLLAIMLFMMVKMNDESMGYTITIR